MNSECLKTIEQVCDALGEELESEKCQEVRKHLESCPKCCAQVDSLRKTVRLFKCYGEVEVPSQADKRLWKVLNLQKPAE
jgi:anti-sigma factor RsiW